MRANRNIARDLEGEGKRLKKGQPAFRRKGDVMEQVRKDKRIVRMISTIHDVTIVSTGRKDRKTNMERKMTYAVDQYNKFMKGVDRADQYFRYHSPGISKHTNLKKIVAKKEVSCKRV